MSAFLKVIASMCAVLIFASGILMITPKKEQGSMRYILSLIVILALCSSVSCNKDVEIEMKPPSSSTYEHELADITATQMVEAFLEDNKINYSSLKVYTTKGDDLSIVISRIELSTSEKDIDVSGMLKLQFPTAEVSAQYE